MLKNRWLFYFENYAESGEKPISRYLSSGYGKVIADAKQNKMNKKRNLKREKPKSYAHKFFLPVATENDAYRIDIFES